MLARIMYTIVKSYNKYSENSRALGGIRSMKKVAILLSVLMLCFGLAACGKKAAPTPNQITGYMK